MKLGLHFLTNVVTPYEFHRDEFLYFAMGEHFQLWRMDIPPAIAMLSELVRGLFGDSLVAIRMVPALFGAGTVFLAGLVARELGGRWFAVGLAAASIVLNPLFLRAGNLFQPVVLDQFAWTLGFYALVRLQRAPSPGAAPSAAGGAEPGGNRSPAEPGTRTTTADDPLRWWLLLGVALGWGLLSKLTIGVLGISVLAALLLTRGLSWLRTRGPWLALALALLLGLPTIVGQLTLDFPVLGYMADLRENQLARVTALQFLGGQAALGPTTFLALAGVVYLLVHGEMAPFRVVGWTVIVTFVLMVVLQAKDYYLGPVYPVCYAAGAVLLERIRARGVGTVVRWATVALVLVFGLGALPYGLPILAPPEMEALAAQGPERAVRTNVGDMERIPQDYADMLGWKRQVEAVAGVYHDLPPEDRRDAIILASNYGEAGAIDFYGTELGLPRALTPVGTYWLYGPGEKPGRVAVVIGASPGGLKEYFREVEAVRTLGHPFAVREERDLTIHVARDPYRPIQEVWPELRGRN